MAARTNLIERRVALQVVVDVAEHGVDHRQPLEVVSDVHLVGHAHAAVELHRLHSVSRNYYFF